MDQESRVLCRNGARELTEQEADHISGGLHTLTLCTASPCSQKDGDASIGECGC
jgi:hypothetical protein